MDESSVITRAKIFVILHIFFCLTRCGSPNEKVPDVSETENAAVPVAEEKIQKPVANESASADEVDRVAVPVKTVLNGDSNHTKEVNVTKAVDSESKAPTASTNAENGLENAVADEKTQSPAETCSTEAAAKSENVEPSTGDVATSKTAEPKESGVDEPPASTPVPESGADKPPAPESGADKPPAPESGADKPPAPESGADEPPASTPVPESKAAPDVADVKSSATEDKPVSGDTDAKEEPVSGSTDAKDKPVSGDTDAKEEPVSGNTDTKDKPVSGDTDAKEVSSEASVGDDKCEKPAEAKSSPAVVEKSEMGAEKAGELFTDDMVEKIEQNYSPTETGTLNLLDMPDDEMLACETKPAAQTNGAAEAKDGEPTDGAEVAEKTDEKSDVAEAANLFLQGKRNMLVKDYESAANILGDACAKYSAIYGDLGVECAEVYMAYGQALLEWWRVEDSNRKNDTVDEAKDEDDGEKGPDEVPVKQNGVDAPPTEEEPEEPMDVDDAAPNADNVENAEDAENADNAEETIDETRTEEQAENDDDEDEIESDEEVDNLQIAFEILEVAKKIYEKTNDDANLAKVHAKLGEISIANGNLTYALEDLKKALELLTPSAAAANVRHKANVHFQLYIVHTMRCSFPEAEAELRVAKSTFESHLRDLERRLQTESGDVDAVTAEIKEIKEVVRDLSEKLVECQKEKRELISAISDVIKTKHPAASVDVPSSSSASVDAPSSSAAAASTFSPRKADVPINNISHLVRKKPKNVTEEAKAEPKEEAEKTGEASAAADAKSNGVEVPGKDSGKAADSGEADDASTKRKAEDVLENDAKKACT